MKTIIIVDSESDRTLDMEDTMVSISGLEDDRDQLISLDKVGAIKMAREILKYYGEAL